MSTLPNKTAPRERRDCTPYSSRQYWRGVGEPRRSADSIIMRSSFNIVVLVVGITLCGCSSTVTRETLMRRATRNDLTSWPDTTYYCGTKTGHDYFFIEHSMPTTSDGRGRTFRVPQSESAITNRFAYTRQRTDWRLYNPTRRL